jgi:hypothetical protein
MSPTDCLLQQEPFLEEEEGAKVAASNANLNGYRASTSSVQDSRKPNG